MDRLSIELWFHNLRWTRIKRVPIDYDFPYDSELRWNELLMCSIGLWPMIIRMKLQREYVPSAVIIVGEKITKEDMEWAERIGAQLQKNGHFRMENRNDRNKPMS